MYTCVINQVADKGSLLFVLRAANILNTSFETVIGLIRIHEGLWREIILSRWTFDDLFFKISIYIQNNTFCLCFFLFVDLSAKGGVQIYVQINFYGCYNHLLWRTNVGRRSIYFIYPFNDKINGQLYTVYFTHIIFSVLPTYAYGIAIFIQTVFWCLQFIIYCYSIVHVCISSIFS